MDKRILAAVAVVGVLVLGSVGTYAMMGSGDRTELPEGARKGAKAKAKAKAADGDEAEAAPGSHQVRVSQGNPHADDPTYLERAKKHREIREAANKAWREETTQLAQTWVASNLDEATGVQVMAAFNKAHDVIAQSRADVEDAVIPPREGREERAWAKEDLRVELNNLLGEEKAQAFLDAVADGKSGGI